ncbi:hypothetical protein [Bacillus sp. 1P02SD]|uniref:hypothetical protein n=1 Tax=Bacillus sp. 1P02SD TaxID=3132264 RepID=UPI0039A20577
MDINEIHSKFIKGEKISVIAYQFGVSERRIQQLISEQRKLAPSKWPSRRNRKSNVHLFHVYECSDCSVTFAVEQAYEDQSDVCCPICWTDTNLRDVASGEMKIT